MAYLALQADLMTILSGLIQRTTSSEHYLLQNQGM